jgi:hypothetical protein
MNLACGGPPTDLTSTQGPAATEPPVVGDVRLNVPRGKLVDPLIDDSRTLSKINGSFADDGPAAQRRCLAGADPPDLPPNDRYAVPDLATWLTAATPTWDSASSGPSPLDASGRTPCRSVGVDLAHGRQ